MNKMAEPSICVDEEEKAAIRTKEEEVRLVSRADIISFAEAIVSLTGKEHNDLNDWLEALGIEPLSHISSMITFPRWHLSSLSYYFKELIGDAEVLDFDGRGKRDIPTYKVTELTRGNSLSMLVEGYAAVEYKGKPLALEIDYGSYACYITALHDKDNKEIAMALLKEIEAKVKNMEFLRGEKFRVTSAHEIKFFDFKTVLRDKIVLSDKIWNILDKNFFFVLENKDKLLENNMDWKRGILISGPPGTGKTLFGSHLCTILDDITVLWVTSRSIGAVSDVEKLFEMARMLSPTIVFIEDLDFFAASRETHGISFVLCEFLQQLDGISPNEGVFVVGTTNDPLALDKAIASRPSRFDVRIEFPYPENGERERLYGLFLRDADVDYSKLSDKSSKLSCTHIKEICIRGLIEIMRNPEKSLEVSIIEAIQEIRDEEMSKPAPQHLVS